MADSNPHAKHSPWLTLLAATAIIGAAFVLLLESDGYRRNRTLVVQENGLASENGRIKAENERLREDITALKSDPETIEQLARQELGMVRPGELTVQPLTARPASP